LTPSGDVSLAPPGSSLFPSFPKEKLAKIKQQFLARICNPHNLADETIRPEDDDGSALRIDWIARQLCQSSGIFVPKV
jgi:hypothetical protein